MSAGRYKHGAGVRKDGFQLPASLCWLIAMAIVIASLRLFLWMLDSAGVIGAEQSGRMMLVALPVALLMLGCLAPSDIED